MRLKKKILNKFFFKKIKQKKRGGIIRKKIIFKRRLRRFEFKKIISFFSHAHLRPVRSKPTTMANIYKIINHLQYIKHRYNPNFLYFTKKTNRLKFAKTLRAFYKFKKRVKNFYVTNMPFQTVNHLKLSKQLIKLRKNLWYYFFNTPIYRLSSNVYNKQLLIRYSKLYDNIKFFLEHNNKSTLKFQRLKKLYTYYYFLQTHDITTNTFPAYHQNLFSTLKTTKKINWLNVAEWIPGRLTNGRYFLRRARFLNQRFARPGFLIAAHRLRDNQDPITKELDKSFALTLFDFSLSGKLSINLRDSLSFFTNTLFSIFFKLPLISSLQFQFFNRLHLLLAKISKRLTPEEDDKKPVKIIQSPESDKNILNVFINNKKFYTVFKQQEIEVQKIQTFLQLMSNFFILNINCYKRNWRISSQKFQKKKLLFRKFLKKFFFRYNRTLYLMKNYAVWSIFYKLATGLKTEISYKLKLKKNTRMSLLKKIREYYTKKKIKKKKKRFLISLFFLNYIKNKILKKKKNKILKTDSDKKFSKFIQYVRTQIIPFEKLQITNQQFKKNYQSEISTKFAGAQKTPINCVNLKTSKKIKQQTMIKILKIKLKQKNPPQINFFKLKLINTKLKHLQFHLLRLLLIKKACSPEQSKILKTCKLHFLKLKILKSKSFKHKFLKSKLASLKTLKIKLPKLKITTVAKQISTSLLKKKLNTIISTSFLSNPILTDISNKANIIRLYKNNKIYNPKASFNKYKKKGFKKKNKYNWKQKNKMSKKKKMVATIINTYYTKDNKEIVQVKVKDSSPQDNNFSGDNKKISWKIKTSSKTINPIKNDTISGKNLSRFNNIKSSISKKPNTLRDRINSRGMDININTTKLISNKNQTTHSDAQDKTKSINRSKKIIGASSNSSHESQYKKQINKIIKDFTVKIEQKKKK